MERLLEIHSLIQSATDPDALPTVLVLNDVDLTDQEKLNVFCSVCEGLPELEEINLQGCLLGDAHSSLLFETLMMAPTVHTVNLAGCSLTDASVDGLAELITDRHGTGAPFRLLNLTGNEITEDSVGMISEALSVSEGTQVMFGSELKDNQDLRTSPDGGSENSVDNDETGSPTVDNDNNGNNIENKIRTKSTEMSGFKTLGKRLSTSMQDQSPTNSSGVGSTVAGPPVHGSRIGGVGLRMDPEQAQSMIRRLEQEVDVLTAKLAEATALASTKDQEQPATAPGSDSLTAPHTAAIAQNDLAREAETWFDDENKLSALTAVAKSRGFPLCTLKSTGLQSTIDRLSGLIQMADGAASDLRVLRSQTLSNHKIRSAKLKGVEVAGQLMECFQTARSIHQGMDHNEENASILMSLLDCCQRATDSYNALRASLGISKRK